MRKIVRILLISFTLFVATPLEVTAQPNLPPRIDMADLNLKIVKTQIVDKISATGISVGWKPGVQPTLSARGENNLVLVTLKGNIQKPCSIPLSSNDFTAVYEEERPALGLKVTSLRKSVAIAKDTNWNVPPEEGSITIILSNKKSGPITLKAAFILPKGVSSFRVRYPTAAQGTSTVSSKSK